MNLTKAELLKYVEEGRDLTVPSRIMEQFVHKECFDVRIVRAGIAMKAFGTEDDRDDPGDREGFYAGIRAKLRYFSRLYSDRGRARAEEPERSGRTGNSDSLPGLNPGPKSGGRKAGKTPAEREPGVTPDVFAIVDGVSREGPGPDFGEPGALGGLSPKPFREIRKPPKKRFTGPPKGQKRLLVNIPEELHEKIMTYAKSKDTSATRIIVDWIRDLR
ncbi:MAG: hypothetical protein LBF41_04735 [Deltaproteobacteria bacterium]|jgi:hypothetical protein|nr:hypothetical protein [Deltaproteobacteria bacterium]